MILAERRLLKKSFLIIKTSVTIGLLWIVFKKIDSGKLVGVLVETNLFFILCAILLGVCSSAIQALRWSLLINNGKIKFIKFLHFIYLGYFVKIFLPGSITGDFAKVYFFSKKYNEPISNSTMIIVFQFLGFFFQWMLGGIGYIMYWKRFDLSLLKNQLNLNWYLIILTGIIAILILFLIFKIKRFNSNVFVKNIIMSLKNKSLLLKSFALTFLLQVFSFAYIFFVLKAIGISVPFLMLSSVLAIINTILIIPISISGVGVTEFLSIIFFTNVLGFPEEKILSANIIGYFLLLFFALIGGGWVLMRKVRSLPVKS